MLSFTATVNVLLLILSIVALHAPRRVAGASANVTIRLDSPSVSFTPGWRVATFAKDGSKFAFADGLNEEVRITLPQQTTEVFYHGYRVAGGALFLACVDCVVDVVKSNIVGANAIIVDAHDSRENGTQPPDTLFSFTNLDPTIQHVLTVFNLEDPKFNNTSQVTFDSVLATIDSQTGGNSTATSSGVIVVPNLPTLTVTAIEPSTSTDVSTTAPPVGHGPNSTDSGDLPGATQTSAPSSTSSSSAGDTTTTSATAGSTTAPGQTGTTTAVSTGDGSAGATQSPGASSTDTQTTFASPSEHSETSGPTPTNTSGTGTGGTNPATSDPPNGSSQPTAGGSPTDGPFPTTGSNPPTGTPRPTEGSSAGPGQETPLPSVSPIFTDPPPDPSGTSSASNNGAASTTGVSKPVIIAIAVVASLFVLALLGAVLFVLVRTRGARPPVDPEGNTGLMREAAPSAVVSAPVGLAPMRPVNPFADTTPSDVPLDAPPEGMEGVEDVSEIEEILAQPQPSLPPPPLPPKSPLRGTFSPRNSPWLTRVPRSPITSAPS